jgi:hypothetical protein
MFYNNHDTFRFYILIPLNNYILFPLSLPNNNFISVTEIIIIIV